MRPTIQDDFSSPRRLSGSRPKFHSNGARYLHILWIVNKKRVVYTPRIMRNLFSKESHNNWMIVRGSPSPNVSISTKLKTKFLAVNEKPGGNRESDMVAWVTCGGIVDQVKSVLRALSPFLDDLLATAELYFWLSGSVRSWFIFCPLRLLTHGTYLGLLQKYRMQYTTRNHSPTWPAKNIYPSIVMISQNTLLKNVVQKMNELSSATGMSPPRIESCQSQHWYKLVTNTEPFPSTILQWLEFPTNTVCHSVPKKPMDYSNW